MFPRTSRAQPTHYTDCVTPDHEKTKYSEEKLSQQHFVHHAWSILESSSGPPIMYFYTQGQILDNFEFPTAEWGHTVAQLIEALSYKPEGRGFNSRWCH